MFGRTVTASCLIGCLLGWPGAEPVHAGVVLRFTGTVSGVTNVGATPPSGVKVGGPIEGTITYVPEEATAFASGLREMTYRFPVDPAHVFRLTIGSRTWIVPLQAVSVCDEGCGGDAVRFAGDAASEADFPGFLYRGEMWLRASTWDPPHSLVNDVRLPAAATDIDFGAADVRGGEIASSVESNFQFWCISFSVDAAALPVRATTWGAIKELYAPLHGGYPRGASEP